MHSHFVGFVVSWLIFGMNVYLLLQKYSDGQVWANSVDPVLCLLFHLHFWAQSYMFRLYYSNFRIITVHFFQMMACR